MNPDAGNGTCATADIPVSQTRPDARYARFGPFVIDLQGRVVYKHGVNVDLNGQKYEVLLTLVEKGNGIVTRNDICERLWQSSSSERVGQVGALISVVRHALRDSVKAPLYIATVSGKGYSLIPQVERSDTPPVLRRPGVELPVEAPDVPAARRPPIAKSPSMPDVAGTGSFARTGEYTALIAAVFLAIVSLTGIALLRSHRVESGLALILTGGILLALISNVAAYFAIRMNVKSGQLPTQ
jgi:DNA-binding winged helix-turn-helix (wHTH) protein